MDYRKPTLMQGLFGAPNFQAMGRPELTEVMNFGTPYYAQKAQRQLARLGPQGLLGGTNFPQAAPFISPQAAAVAQAAMPQPSRLIDNVSPMPRPSIPSDMADQIERKSVPAGLLGQLGEGVRGAGQELSGLFSGPEGQLRARELSKALMTGPTRVPVSFGQSLVEGLASGGELIDLKKAEQAKMDMALAKAAKEASEKEAADLGSGEAAREKAYAVVSSVDDAIDILDEHGGWAAGFGSWLKDIPTTPANRMKLALDTIKAQIGFKELQAMREASKTGGALGQVTVRELELLQRTIAAIEPELKPKDLKSNLKKVREVMMAIANGVQDPRTGEVRSIAESASSKSSSGDVVMVTAEDMED